MTSHNGIRWFLLPMLLFACALVGCRGVPAPVEDRTRLAAQSAAAPATHIVQRGDTLYSIAFRYDLDYQQLARINGIGNDYRIYVGQTLKLKGDAPKAPANASAKQTSTASAKRTTSKAAPAASTSTQRAAVPTTTAPAKWIWPVNGKVERSFSRAADQKRGIDIAAGEGTAVLAAADGVVVYAGASLHQYGNLLIIKHGGDFLSAYAYNSRLLVGEGSAVRAGDKISEVGRTGGADHPKLHFQIRHQGVPVDPQKYLPAR